MKSFRKIAAPVACVVAICGAAIAWHVYRQKTIERKLVEEARVCRVRAEQGDAKAEYDLGHMYYYGHGVPHDYAEALRWFRKAADQGYAKADYGIGYMNHFGQSVPRDAAEAFRWYHKAADLGDKKAQCALGLMYYDGQGVTQDYGEAARWYRKAADQGEAKAQDGLGSAYYHGRGVVQDYAEAVRWYRQAANQGLASAEYNLGFMYLHGYGVPQDRAESHRWFQKAADQGDGYARRALGIAWLGFTKMRLVIFLIQVFGGLFFLTWFLRPGKSLRNYPERIAALTGVLCLISAGLYWYGYTHHLPFGFNAFSVLRGLLDGVVLSLLFYIFRMEKKAGEEQRGINGPATSAGGGGVLGL